MAVCNGVGLRLSLLLYRNETGSGRAKPESRRDYPRSHQRRLLRAGQHARRYRLPGRQQSLHTVGDALHPSGGPAVCHSRIQRPADCARPAVGRYCRGARRALGHLHLCPVEGHRAATGDHCDPDFLSLPDPDRFHPRGVRRRSADRQDARHHVARLRRPRAGPGGEIRRTRYHRHAGRPGIGIRLRHRLLGKQPPDVRSGLAHGDAPSFGGGDRRHGRGRSFERRQRTLPRDGQRVVGIHFIERAVCRCDHRLLSVDRHGRGAAATFFLNLEPIVVIGTGYVVLDQAISSWQMVGVAVVVAALGYASQPERSAKLETQSAV